MEYLLSQAKSLNQIQSNPYFQKLLQNPSPANFVKSQESFINAVNEWSKLLALLLTKVPTHNERLPIIENLLDEHGNGDLKMAHIETFRKFVQSFDPSHSVVLYNQNSPTFHIIREFYETLYQNIKYYNWVHIAAMLGMIEYIYIQVSMAIHQYAKQYISEEKIYHYTLHETLDTKHSEDLFRIVIPYMEDEQNRQMIQLGLQAGYDAMSIMYEKLSYFL